MSYSEQQREGTNLESITALTIEQIDYVFEQFIALNPTCDNPALSHFIQTWRMSDSRMKAHLYQAAQSIIYGYKLEPHWVPWKMVGYMSFEDAATIARGIAEDHANPQEQAAISKCAYAAEFVAKMKSDLQDYEEGR